MSSFMFTSRSQRSYYVLTLSGVWEFAVAFCGAFPDIAFVVSPKRNYTGKLLAVEGLDGSGKSTQIYLVKRWLELEGYRVFFTEWNSSILVKKSTTKGKKRQLLT